MIGSQYICKGERVKVLCRWLWSGKGTRKNVLLRGEGGAVVRAAVPGIEEGDDMKPIELVDAKPIDPIYPEYPDGERLYQARRRAAITVSEAARRLDMCTCTYSKLERGVKTLAPGEDMDEVIAQVTT